jgi:two-component system OmpR family sensor kinase
VTLRTKLIAGIVGLIIALSAVIGVTTEIFLSRYLVGQLDQQLSGATDRIRPPDSTASGTTEGPQPPAGSGGTTTAPPGAGSLNRAGNRTGTLLATLSEETVVTCAVLVESTTPADATTTTASRYRAVPKLLPASSCSSLATLSPNTQPETVMIDGQGSYRVKAVADSQSPGSVLVAGLPMEDVQNVQQRLAVIMALVAGACRSDRSQGRHPSVGQR